MGSSREATRTGKSWEECINGYISIWPFVEFLRREEMSERIIAPVHKTCRTRDIGCLDRVYTGRER